MTLRHFAALLRCDQWIKNTFVFIPAFFAARLWEGAIFWRVGLAFVAFCFLSSVIYILNDTVDRKRDRQHPKKRDRPIASGAVSLREAAIVAIILLIFVILLSWQAGGMLWIVLSSYLVINLFYSYWLKHIALLDISLIALGFLLRIFAGAVVVDIPVSRWLIVLTFLLALLLAFGKRRGEFNTQSGKTTTRPSLEGYNLVFINQAMVFLAAVIVVAYLMYTISDEVVQRIGSEDIYFTTFFVILGLLRYLQLALVYEQVESPTKVLFRDHFIQVLLLLWILSFGYLLYF